MATTTQPLALRSDAPEAPAVFGSRDEIQAVAKRISVMLPSAHLADWQLARNDRAEIERRLNNSVYRAAQLSVFYRLVPGEDVHVIPFGNDWAVDMGIETWKKAADRYCSLHGITYHIHTEEMSLEELKDRRGNDYHPNDYGVVAYLWRSDKKEAYGIFGAKQSMTRATGIWRQQANQKKNGEWQADNIPTHRTKQDVAKRRAMKAVLKLEFSLDSLLAATPAEVRGSIQVLDSRLRSEERMREIPHGRNVEFEDDDCCFPSDAKPARAQPQDIEFVVVDEDGVIDTPDIDEMQEGDPMQDEQAATDYETLAATLTGKQASFAKWTRQTDLNSNGQCTVAQYRYLVGVLNKIAGVENSHHLLLGVLCKRQVDSSNLPGRDVAAKLLEWLVADHKDEVTGEKITNPAYRADYVDCIKEIYAAISAA